jgi:anti-sigma factor RsiW
MQSMNRCEDIRSRLTMYLDHELEGHELNSFEAHLVECAQCQAIFEHERRFLETIRELRPLHTASAELKDRARAIIQQGPETSLAPVPAGSRIRQVRNRRGFWAAAAAASLLLLIIPAAVWLIRTNHQSVSAGPQRLRSWPPTRICDTLAGSCRSRSYPIRATNYPTGS